MTYGIATQGDDDDDAVLRTFEGIRADQEQWVSSAAKQASLKNHFNCRNHPLDIFSSTGIVLYFVPPSALHIILGLTNLMYKEMVVVFPGGKAWPARLHITQSDYFSGTWEGRQSRKLLANVSVLEEIIREDDMPRRTRNSIEP